MPFSASRTSYYLDVVTGRRNGLAASMIRAGLTVPAYLLWLPVSAGARERLGLLSIAVEAEKEVLYLAVPAEHQDLIAASIYKAGGLDAPGGGFLYITPLEKLATYIPEDALERLAGQS